MIIHIMNCFVPYLKEISDVKILETRVKYDCFIRSFSDETYCNYKYIVRY